MVVIAFAVLLLRRHSQPAIPIVPKDRVGNNPITAVTREFQEPSISLQTDTVSNHRVYAGRNERRSILYRLLRLN